MVEHKEKKKEKKVQLGKVKMQEIKSKGWTKVSLH